MTARVPSVELSPAAALIRGAVAPEQQEELQDTRRWRAMESAITLGILLIVLVSVTDSIASAGWVDGMPDVRLTAVLALAVAAALSWRSVHWLPALLGGLLLGAIVVFRQVLSMEQFDGQSWFWERFTDLRFRLDDWFTQAFNDGITTDNVPFVFFIVVAIWLVTFPCVLLVLRRRNPWPLLILLGVVLSINVSYLDSEQWDFHFAFYVGGAALLVMRTSLLSRMARWRARGTPFPDFISFSFIIVTFVAVVGLMAISRAAPRPDRAEPLAELWSGITAPFDELSLEFERLFSGIDSQRGAPIHDFGSNFILKGDINPGQGIVVRVDAPESGLLRGATYDRYTTRGWQQRAVVSAVPPPDEPFSGEEDSAYLSRREVTTRLSVEQSPRVLFTFGIPTQISRAVTIDETAPSRVTLDIANGGAGAPIELAEAARAIAASEAEGESFAPDVIPPGWAPVGSDVDIDGTLLALELENRPLEPDVVTVRPDESVRAGFTYEVTGSVSAATVEELQASGRAYPYWVTERYLQLPSDLDDGSLERLRRLAAGVVGGAANRYQFASAIEGYLCCTALRGADGSPLLDAEGQSRVLYPFITDLETPPPLVDAVTWWLLDNVDDAGLPIGGYYDYHASAMAVLLRTLGVPARVSTGYVLTEDNFDPRTGTYIVRGQDAYSWVEVFFPEYGWVDFDPTPPVVSEGFGGIAGERIAAQRLRPFASDIFANERTQDLSDPFADFEELQNLAGDLRLDLDGGGTGFTVWWVLAPLIVVAALGAVSGTGLMAWKLSLRGLTPVERLWMSTQRLSRWSGLPADPADTPQEYGALLGAAVRDPAASRTLAATYTRARFRPGALTDSELGAAQGAWRALRRRLLLRVFRLPVPAAPLVGDASAGKAGIDPDEAPPAPAATDASGEV